MGCFTISKELKKAFSDKGVEPVPLKKVKAKKFYKIIGQAKRTNKFGAYVSQYSVKEYQEMSYLLLTLDEKAGIAITKDNDIVSVFNSGKKRGVLKTLLPVAIDLGGNKLDNYDGKLSALYELYGFEPVSMVKFNCHFAPDDWNYERDGMPDIVFWKHNGDSVAEVVCKFGSYLVSWDNICYFDTYEEAAEYRNRFLK